MSNLRVGFINENLGGHATFHRNLIRSLREVGGIDCEVVDVPRRGLLGQVLVQPIPQPRGLDLDFPLLRHQMVKSPGLRRRVYDLAARSDVVHTYSQNALPSLRGHLCGTPLVVTTDATCSQTRRRLPARSPGVGAGLDARLASRVEGRLLRAADAVLAQSWWAYHQLGAEGQVPPERLHLTRAGAPRPRPAVRREPGSRVRVAYVGATMRRKGGWRLIQALEPELGTRVEVHVVTHSPVAPRPGVIVHRNIWPNDDRVFEVLEQADIFALPTDTDMSPNAILEAMACGLPIVSTATAGIPEMVDDGVNGHLVAPGDDAGLRGALLDLIGAPARRSDFGDASRAILAGRFDPRAAAERFVDILRAVARTGAPGDRSPRR